MGSGTDRRSFFTFSVTERGRGKTRVWQIFNTTAYERTECVELKVWDYPGDLNNTVLRDEEGREYAFDILERQTGFWHLHTYAKICAQVTDSAFRLQHPDLFGAGGVSGTEDRLLQGRRRMCDEGYGRFSLCSGE